MALLNNKKSEDFYFPEDSLIGKGSIASVHRCWLADDPSMRTLALKIFDFSDPSRSQWILKHMAQEVTVLRELSKESVKFISVKFLYNQGSKLTGFAMEYCRHGSLRKLSAQLSRGEDQYPWLKAHWMLQVSDAFHYLQTRPKGVIFHRELSADSVLIDDQLGIKITDFGLFKKSNEVTVSQSTLELQKTLGIHMQLPETFDNPSRPADQYGDRYFYGMLVVEVFGQLSLEEQIGGNAQMYVGRFRSGTHLQYFLELLQDNCFDKIPSDCEEHNFLKQTIKQVVQKMAELIPEQRSAFAEIFNMWKSCNTDRMEQQRQHVLRMLQEELKRAIAPDVDSESLKILWNTDVEFPPESLIGKGSFATCHRCQLKSSPSDAPLALKIFKMEDNVVKKTWQLKHMVHEIKYMHDISNKHKSFIKVLYLYCHEVNQLIGYGMEYCKHGSMRLFSKRLATMQPGTTKARHPWLVASWMLQVSEGFNYLQSRQNGGILHRDLAIDNVLIDDLLNAKIADFGLSKRSVESVATQNTLEFDSMRGIERRLPETYDDPLRQPDLFGDRYLYAIFVVEAFGMLSVRQQIGDRIEEFKERVRQGLHIKDFHRLLDDGCFSKLPLAEQTPDLEQLQETAKQVISKMGDKKPEKRATFAEISGLWQQCNLNRMNEERNRVLDRLRELPPADTIPSADARAQTVSLGVVEEEFNYMGIDDAATGLTSEPSSAAAPSNQQQSSSGSAMDVSANSQQRTNSSQSTVAPAFTVQIGTVGGDVVNFKADDDAAAAADAAAASAAGGAKFNARVVQRLPVMSPSSPVELLSRSYAEIVATEHLARLLCSSKDLASKRASVLDNLGLSQDEFERLKREYPYSPADILYQGLIHLINSCRLTVSQLGTAFKNCGCLEGLKILLDYERDLSR